MEVIGKSKRTIILETCLRDSTVYFSDHERIIRCNPYCTHVVFIPESDMYKWVFQVNDPRDNPITAVFFVRQLEDDGNLDSPHPGEAPGGLTGRCIRWVSAGARRIASSVRSKRLCGADGFTNLPLSSFRGPYRGSL